MGLPPGATNCVGRYSCAYSYITPLQHLDDVGGGAGEVLQRLELAEEVVRDAALGRGDDHALQSHGLARREPVAGEHLPERAPAQARPGAVMRVFRPGLGDEAGRGSGGEERQSIDTDVQRRHETRGRLMRRRRNRGPGPPERGGRPSRARAQRTDGETAHARRGIKPGVNALGN